MSYFNSDQRSWMEYLSKLPPEKKCKCGWDHKGSCYNCNRDELIARGGKIQGENYILPDGTKVDYSRLCSWISTINHYLYSYNSGDVVVATADFHDRDLRTGHVDNIKKGETDVVESVSSDHHGGLQLNLVKNGRGWNNHVWRKLSELSVE